MVIVIVILSACSEGRDISSVESAIIGHWISKSTNPKFEDTHYYISKNQVTSLNGEGEKTVFDYVITTSSEKKGWIEIKLTSTSGGGHEKRIEFKNDERTKIFSTYDIDDIFGDEELDKEVEVIKSLKGNLTFDENWDYIDNLSRPK
jgi:hypothetical protein